MANENVIYISTHNVQVIKGSCDKGDMIKINDFEQYDVEEGAMMNGVITDDVIIKEILGKIASKGVKETKLVIDSGQMLLKNIDVPLLGKKELIKICKDELASIDGSDGDLVYDYCVLRDSYEDKSGGEILCVGVERKLITSYMELFESVGIKLKSIDIAENALHKLTREIADINQKTYVLVIVDGNNVATFLFENNHYTFSNRTRLFSERGSEDFVSEMNSNISQMIQFSKSKQSENIIDTAYFCGLLDEEETAVFARVKEALHIEAEVFPNSKIIYVKDKVKEKMFQLHDYVFPIGCLIRK
ncbi:MAG: pilus assembly protein PilM [Longicatena sp.]